MFIKPFKSQSLCHPTKISLHQTTTGEVHEKAIVISSKIIFNIVQIIFNDPIEIS